jgi:transcriptional regulator with XRE-family HTH domain
MTTRQLVRALGGGAAVAQRCGVTRQAVSHWLRAGAVPAVHVPVLAEMALAAGLSWEPPGADAIRAQLAAPSKAKAA